jgi:hypothetical protein
MKFNSKQFFNLFNTFMTKGKDPNPYLWKRIRMRILEAQKHSDPSVLRIRNTDWLLKSVVKNFNFIAILVYVLLALHFKNTLFYWFLAFPFVVLRTLPVPYSKCSSSSRMLIFFWPDSNSDPALFLTES